MTETCHICEAGNLLVLDESFARCVTSDCRPCDTPQAWCVCKHCGTVQKRLDETWRRSVADIYSSYVMYGQSGGVEQGVFDQASGQSVTRSGQVIHKLLQSHALQEAGRLLDVGCGNGAFLQAFGAAKPKWSLAGSELDARNRDAIEKLPMVERLYTGPLAGIPGTFDVISLIHVLEHIVNPVHLLRSLHAKLRDGGLLVIELPGFEQNPFDLMIADHCTHFTLRTICSLTEAAGFQIETSTSEWIPKELSIVGKKASLEDKSGKFQANTEAGPVVSQLRWLKRVADTALGLSSDRTFGIFGTSIAGSWLCGLLEDRVAFFVDEDVRRIGRVYMDRPIYSPAAVPPGATVFIAQPPAIAAQIQQRLKLQHPAFDFCLPPAS